MDLYLIRHGESEGAPKPDRERNLTTAGVEAVKKTALQVTKIAPPPAAILSSPLRRAIETAGYFAMGWHTGVEVVDWLQSECEPSVIIEELKKRPLQSTALIGHLPCLGLLMGTLQWGLPPKEVMIPRGGVAYLTMSSLEPGTAKLKWLVSPENI